MLLKHKVLCNFRTNFGNKSEGERLVSNKANTNKTNQA